MSLILDALKKSENERQRQGSPAMFEIRVTPPRARFPTWAVALGLLLGVNLIVVLVVLLLREPAGTDNAPATQPPAPPLAQAPAQAPAPPAAPTPAQAAVDPAATAPPQGAAAASASRFNPPLIEDPALAAEDSDAAAGPYGATAAAVAAAANAPAPARGGVVAGMPDRAALVAAGTQVPEVTISLHAWDRNPAARFVFIDGARASEGTVLASGVRVEQITPEGTVLSFRGARFLVPIQ